MNICAKHILCLGHGIHPDCVPPSHPALIDYSTNETIRQATAAELAESVAVAARDGGAGVIEVEGRRCYAVE